MMGFPRWYERYIAVFIAVGIIVILALSLAGCACRPDERGQCINWSQVGGWGGTFGW
jgi:hypothetical protein